MMYVNVCSFSSRCSNVLEFGENLKIGLYESQIITNISINLDTSKTVFWV